MNKSDWLLFFAYLFNPLATFVSGVVFTVGMRLLWKRSKHWSFGLIYAATLNYIVMQAFVYFLQLQKNTIVTGQTVHTDLTTYRIFSITLSVVLFGIGSVGLVQAAQDNVLVRKPD